MAQKKLDYILQPGQIGSLTVKNRLIHMGSHGSLSQKGKGDAPVSSRWLCFYEGLAAGGFSLVSCGGGIVKLDDSGEKGFSTVISAWPFEGLQILADTIKKHDSRAFWQLLLGYPNRLVDPADMPSWAASALSEEELVDLIPYYRPTTELSIEQINVITDTFADSAVRLREAGFEGVEINAGHDHGLNTFLSPAWNKRTDEYGGSPENRARILCEIIRKTKERCGSDFPVVANFSGAEFGTPNGRRPAESAIIAKCAEAAGADLIHSRFEMYMPAVPELGIPRTGDSSPDVDLYPIWVGKDLSEYGIDNSYGNGKFAWVGAAAEIKKAVNIPVSVSGRTDAFIGNELIKEGKLDFISICRRAHADPDYCKKVIEGRYEDIRPCVGCNTCQDMSDHSSGPWCMVNPGASEDQEYNTILPAETKKRVLVIGSGAAGLEAARVAALRGHEVIIAERESALGGTLPLAGMMKDFHDDFLGFSKWQVRQVEKLGCDIRTKTNVDRAYVEKVAPDAIIVAVGGKEPECNIPGIDNKIVVTGEKLHDMLRTATKFFNVEKLSHLSKLYLPLGKKVVLIGGAMQGLQTARFLMLRGREVVIVEESNEFGKGMLDTGPKPNMLRWLTQQHVEMYKNVTCKEITNKGVVIVDADGNEKLIEANNVVTTLPMLPNLSLYEEVKDLAPEVYAIGDCNPLVFDEPYPSSKIEPVQTETMWPSFTVTAVREAYRIARGI